jgi:hypothetical protein
LLNTIKPSIQPGCSIIQIVQHPKTCCSCLQIYTAVCYHKLQYLTFDNYRTQINLVRQSERSS